MRFANAHDTDGWQRKTMTIPVRLIIDVVFDRTKQATGFPPTRQYFLAPAIEKIRVLARFSTSILTITSATSPYKVAEARRRAGDLCSCELSTCRSEDPWRLRKFPACRHAGVARLPCKCCATRQLSCPFA